MAIVFTSPLDLAAQTGFTTPQATLSHDTPPNPRSTQWAVTATSGTIPNGRTHKISDPFTLTLQSPARYNAAPNVNSLGLIVGTVPMNEYRLRTRKGVYVYGTVVRVMVIETIVKIPAGADSVDSNAVRAALGLHGGAIAQQSANMGNSLNTGLWA